MEKQPDVRIQLRVTLDERLAFFKMADACGFKSLSEFFRVAAQEKVRRDRPDLMRDK